MIHKLKISVGNIEDNIISMLHAMRLVDDSASIEAVRLPIKTKDGLVEITVVTSERK